MLHSQNPICQLKGLLYKKSSVDKYFLIGFINDFHTILMHENVNDPQ